MKIYYKGGDLQRYIAGYRSAAEHLSAQLVDVGPHNYELVYPVVFLYRHYLELQLKSIINDGRVLLGLGSGFPKHHRLRELWDLARNLMQRVGVRVHSQASAYLSFQSMAKISTAIADFAAIDPGAIAFRYPEGTDGFDNYLDQDFIEAAVLSERMRLVIEKLTDLDLACALLLEFRTY